MNPRISSERSDSGEPRINKICELISESKFGIHDISRLRAKTSDEYYRQNLPFEFGIDFGSRIFGSDQLQQKQHLILEKDSHEYVNSFSDISGMDIKSHNNEPDKVICAVRNWFYETVGLKNSDDFTTIWFLYSDFQEHLDVEQEAKGLTQDEAINALKLMPVSEFIDQAKEWISENK